MLIVSNKNVMRLITVPNTSVKMSFRIRHHSCFCNNIQTAAKFTDIFLVCVNRVFGAKKTTFRLTAIRLNTLHVGSSLSGTRYSLHWPTLISVVGIVFGSTTFSCNFFKKVVISSSARILEPAA